VGAKEENMRKWLILLMIMSLGLAVFAAQQQGAEKKGTAAVSQKAQPDRLSGKIIRSSPEKSMLVVQERKTKAERTVIYSDATLWTKGKGTEKADKKEFKDGVNVICLGKYDENRHFIASQINLPPQ
jgi:hypothetical protein